MNEHLSSGDIASHMPAEAVGRGLWSRLVRSSVVGAAVLVAVSSIAPQAAWAEPTDKDEGGLGSKFNPVKNGGVEAASPEMQRLLEALSADNETSTFAKPVTGTHARPLVPELPSPGQVMKVTLGNVKNAFNASSDAEYKKTYVDPLTVVDSPAQASQPKDTGPQDNAKPEADKQAPIPVVEQIEGKATPGYESSKSEADYIWLILGDPAKQKIVSSLASYQLQAEVPKDVQVVTISTQRVLAVHATKGNNVVVTADVGSGFRSVYGGMSKNIVTVGQELQAGQVIGRTGGSEFTYSQLPAMIDNVPVNDVPAGNIDKIPYNRDLMTQLAPAQKVWAERYAEAHDPNASVAPVPTAAPSEAPAEDKTPWWKRWFTPDDPEPTTEPTPSALPSTSPEPTASSTSEPSPRVSESPTVPPPSATPNTSETPTTDPETQQTVLKMDKDGTDKYARALYLAKVARDAGMSEDILVTISSIEAYDVLSPSARNSGGHVGVGQGKYSTVGKDVTYGREMQQAEQVDKDRITEVYPFEHQALDFAEWAKPKWPGATDPTTVSDEELAKIAMRIQGVKCDSVNTPYCTFGTYLKSARELLDEAKQKYPNPAFVFEEN